MHPRIYCPGKVLASIDFRNEYHVITPRIYIKYESRTGKEK